MSEQEASAPPSAVDEELIKATSEVPEDGTDEAPRFRPMSMPSAPFWLAVIAGVVLAGIVLATWSVVFMFAIGVAWFAITLPVVNWMARHGFPRAMAALLVVVAGVLAFIVGLLWVADVFVTQFVPFVVAIPEYLAEAEAQAPPLLASAIATISDGIVNATANADVGTLVLGFLQGILGLAGTLLSLTLLPFFVFYLLVDQPRMARGMKEDVPRPWRPYIDTATSVFVRDFAQYFKAELVVAAIQGTMVTIGVYVIGLIVGAPFSEYVLLLGLIAAFMEFLPSIGPILALIPALLLAIATSPLAVVLVLVFYVIVFIIEANILVPNIEGQVVSFSAATVLFLVAVGFALGGIVGGILALPMAAIVRDLFGFVFRQLQRDSLVDQPAP